MANSTINAQIIINKANRLAQKQQYIEPPEPNNIRFSQFKVPKPDLSKFDRYLTLNQGEANYV